MCIEEEGEWEYKERNGEWKKITVEVVIEETGDGCGGGKWRKGMGV